MITPSADFSASESLASESPTRRSKRVLFDPTINLGHVLTFAGFMVVGLTTYSTLDKRVTLAEQQNIVQEARAKEADVRMTDALKELKNDVKDVQRSVSDVNRTLAIVSQSKK